MNRLTRYALYTLAGGAAAVVGYFAAGLAFLTYASREMSQAEMDDAFDRIRAMDRGPLEDNEADWGDWFDKNDEDDLDFPDWINEGAKRGTYDGIPIIESNFVPEGRAYLIDSSKIVVPRAFSIDPATWPAPADTES